MNLDLIILIGYTIYLIILLFISFFAAKKHNNYSVLANPVSALGYKDSPLNKLFNLFLVLFGISTYFFSTVLVKYLFLNTDKIHLFFVMISVVVVVIGLFPWDRYPKIHNAAAATVFVLVSILAGLLLPGLYSARWYPNILLLINLPTLIAVLVFSVHIINKILKGNWSKHAFLWEWIAYYLMIFQLLFMSISLIFSI